MGKSFESLAAEKKYLNCIELLSLCHILKFVLSTIPFNSSKWNQWLVSVEYDIIQMMKQLIIWIFHSENYYVSRIYHEIQNEFAYYAVYYYYYWYCDFNFDERVLGLVRSHDSFVFLQVISTFCKIRSTTQMWLTKVLANLMILYQDI